MSPEMKSLLAYVLHLLQMAEPKTDSNCSSWYPSADEFWKLPLPCPQHYSLIFLHHYENRKPTGNSDLFEMVWGSCAWKNID